MRQIALAGSMAAALAASASAQSIDSMGLAMDLGGILGAEAPCGLSYNQAAISAWIDENTDPADMSFSSMLTTMSQGSEYNFRDLSESAKTARCRSVERTARHYGFID